MFKTLPIRVAKSALLLTCLVPCALAQELPTSPGAIATPALAEFHPVPPIALEIKGTSGDGSATLLVIADHDLPLVEGRLIFEAGTLREPKHQPGLGELYAEALREGGCSDFTGIELNTWLDAHAVQLSFAMTEDHLRIEYSCLAEDLEGTLDRIGALLRAPSFSEQAVEVARMQLLTGIARANDDPAELGDMAMKRLLLGASTRFGQVATTSTVASIRIEDLRAFHEANIGIDRMLMGITGDVKTELAERYSTAAVAGLPVVGLAPPTEVPNFWLPDNTTIYVVDRPGVPQTELLFGAPGLLITDKDHAALTLWSYVVGSGGMSNRIAQRVRTDLGLAYGVGCGFSSGIARPGQFYAFCGTRNDAVAEAVSEMMDVITAPNFDLVPKAELEAARSRLLGGHVFRYDSAAEQLDRAMTLRLYGLAPDFWETNIARMGEVTPEEVSLAAVKMISPARFLCIAVGPADEIVPKLATVANVVLLDDIRLGGTPVDDAKVLVDSMLANLGGREIWSELESVYVKKLGLVQGPRGPYSVPSEEWTTFSPLQFRSDQRGSNGLVTSTVIRINKGWTKTAFKLSEMSAQAINGRKSQLRRSLYLCLHRLATKDPSVVATVGDMGELVLSVNGNTLCSLSIDERGLPVTMTLYGGGATETLKLLEWSREGVYPFVTQIEGNSGARIRIAEFTANPEVPEQHFELRK
ncbi:MAG: zinc protease [Bacteroidia bacterium]|jgi:zinc protease